MKPHKQTNKLSPAGFARAFPTLAAAIGDRMSKEQAKAIVDAAPALEAPPVCDVIVDVGELAALRQRKERGEELWRSIAILRRLKSEKSGEIAAARANARELETDLEEFKEQEEELIAAHLCLDGGPGQCLLPFTESKPADKPDDVWMEVPTAALVPNQAIASKLIDHGLLTFGAVEAWRAKVNSPGGEDHRIKGFGPAKMQVVEDAIVKYWADHPVKKEDNSVASPAPAV